MLWRARVSLATLAVRWLVLVVAALVVFRRLSVSLLVADLGVNAGLSYLVVVPLLAVLAAVSVQRQGRPVVEIHDRETDVIVGGFVLVVTISAAALLTPELGPIFHLWRIDLLLVWSFSLGAAILLFGLRRAIQYRRAWLVLLLLWPLPFRLVVFTVGEGNLVTIEVLLLLIATAVVAQGSRPAERWWPVPLVAAPVGAVLVAILPVYHLTVLIAAPAATVALIALVWWWRADAGRPRQRLRAPVVSRPWTSYGALLVACLVSLVLVPAPPPVVTPQVPDGMAAAPAGDGVPSGWQLVSRSGYPDQTVFFGRGSTWQRSVLEADGAATAPDAVDSKGVRRRAVVDELTTQRIRTLTIFPLQTTYGDTGTTLSAGEPVDLGHGVEGTLHSGVDIEQNVTWTLLTFTVALPANRATTPVAEPDLPIAQRITVILVDDHRPDATFPQPQNAILGSVRSTLSGILRGTGSVEQAPPKTPQLAIALARQLLELKVGVG